MSITMLPHMIAFPFPKRGKGKGNVFRILSIQLVRRPFRANPVTSKGSCVSNSIPQG